MHTLANVNVQAITGLLIWAVIGLTLLGVAFLVTRIFVSKGRLVELHKAYTGHIDDMTLSGSEFRNMERALHNQRLAETSLNGLYAKFNVSRSRAGSLGALLTEMEREHTFVCHQRDEALAAGEALQERYAPKPKEVAAPKPVKPAK